MQNFRFEDLLDSQDIGNSISETLSLLQNKEGAMQHHLKKDRARKGGLNEFSDFKPVITSNQVQFFIPVITKSESNTITVKKKNGKYTTEHWTQAHKRHKKQKNATFFAFLEVKQFVKLPCKIKYIRYAPRLLDEFGNLPTSMKYLHDSICEELTGDYRPGRADSDKRITASCDQVKSKTQGVLVIIDF